MNFFCTLSIRLIIQHTILLFSLFFSSSLYAENATDSEQITIQLKWKHSFQFAGYYAALEQGYFWDEGLDAQIVEGGPDIDPLNEVLKKRAQYGVGGGDIIYYRLQKKPIVAVATIFQHSAAALATKKDSEIITPHDLYGKKVGMLVGGKPIIEIAAMLEFEGISLKNLILSENTVIDKALQESDAEFIYLSNEPYFFEKAQQKINLIKPLNYGIDFYGDTLFTTESEVRSHADRVERVRRAVIRGWEYALLYPEKMARHIHESYQTNTTLDHIKYQANVAEQLILPNIIEIGHMNSLRWRRMADTIVKLDMVSNSENFDGFIYKSLEDRNDDRLWGIIGFILAIAFVAALASLIFWLINRQLTKRVQLKTEELQSANKQLSEEIHQRKYSEKKVRKKGEELELTVDLRTRELNIEVFKHQETIKTLKSNELRLEQARQSADKANKVKGQFLANMSHEIRTPLNTITGMYHLLQQTDLAENQRGYLQHINTSSQLLIHVIDDILDFSKIEAGTLKFELCNLNIRDLVHSLCAASEVKLEQKEITLNIVIDENIPDILNGYKVRLTQVLSNLLSNAIKFTQKNGAIELLIDIKEKNDKQYTLDFSVKDSGIGISESDIRNLFSPFYQVNSSLSRQLTGTGLGLAISQNLVMAMGGEISCKSRPNQGSVFSFVIPFGYHQPILDHQKENTEINTPASTHILIVDDDPLNRMIVRELLKPYAEKITEVESGQKALKIVNKTSFSIIFMDIQMPDMDGYETTRQLRVQEKLNNIPIIAMTAHASEEDYDKTLRSSMNDHITKPISPSKLIEMLSKWTTA